MEDKSVIVIGAGMAGLAAARCLSAAGCEVTILEARDRIGGRVFTVEGEGRGPVELGAEFIHGSKNRSWELIREAKLKTQEVPDRHWLSLKGRLREDARFREELDRAMGELDAFEPDEDFKAFLRKSKLPVRAKWLAREYVEGFHAAQMDQIGTKALTQANAAAERDEGTRQFRLTKGYGALATEMLETARTRNASIHYSTVVQKVRWEPGRVRVKTRVGRSEQEFTAANVVVTLPLGVLQKGDVVFEPRLIEKEKPIRSLRMGGVMKLTLKFRSCFWRVGNFGFIHSDNEHFPTWWAYKGRPILTAWAGGPRAEALSGMAATKIQAEALRALERIFKVTNNRVRELFVGSHFHNWSADPFARGAYSYTPAGMTAMPGRLAAPIAETLFFAGEATDTQGEQGTVHGAIGSGERAAGQILDASRRCDRSAYVTQIS
jgi:monoamine oxidase